MVLEKLSSALKKTTDKIANAVFLDKGVVDSIIRDLQRALIEADVNVRLVMELSEKVRKIGLDERIKGIEKREHMIKLLHDLLIEILGETRSIRLGKRNIFLFVGLYGSGKTTTIGKLASYYAKRGNKVCAIGLDVHRPAAPEQLRQICEKARVKCFIDKEEKNPLEIWKKFEKETKEYDIVLVDSAGRDALEDSLIEEIREISKKIKPSECFLVMQADIGQAAKRQAEAFKDMAGITGVIITRMDSSAKGGGVLTACAEARAGVVFIGVGENPHDLESFDPEAFLSRLLGMGDLKSLLEKVHSVMDQKQIEKQQRRIQEGKFTLRDLQEQLESMDGFSFSKVLGLVPGLGKVKDKIGEDEIESQESKVRRWKHIINSMTPEEIESPELIERQTSRIQRIAHGSGARTSDVRALIKQYKILKEMTKSQKVLESGELDQKTMMKLARKFGKKMRF